MEAVLAATRKKLSLVDCASFQTMRELGVRSVFCFDSHFREQGFDALP
jgi:predicted nucleic acid-binding protein